MRLISKKQQRGVSLVVAIFILVVLSMLGAALMNIISAGSESVAREVLSSRALMAAESGAQRMLSVIYEGDNTDCINQPPYTFVAFAGCGNVQVNCSVVSVSGDFYYTIESTGVCGPVAEQASRIIEVQAKNI